MDWEKHELKILIDHHHEHARNQAELAAMFQDGPDADPEFVKKCLGFAHNRLKRATELQDKLDKLS